MKDWLAKQPTDGTKNLKIIIQVMWGFTFCFGRRYL